MMSRHGAVELDWADGMYTFRLGLAEIEELEEKRDAGLFSLLARLSPERRAHRLLDVVEVLRLGLIGGGTAPVRALQLVKKYVDERPVEENRDAAYSVVLAGLARVHTDELEEAGGKQEAPSASGSTSAPSTQPQS